MLQRAVRSLVVVAVCSVLSGCQVDYTEKCRVCAPVDVCAVNVGTCEDEKFEDVHCCPKPQECVDPGARACFGTCMDAMQSCANYPFEQGCHIDDAGRLVFVACD